MSQKTVFLIAGYDLHETAKTNYKILKDGLVQKSYSVVPVDISWRQKTHTQYVEEFKSVYNRYKTEENIVVGNSFGAAIAFISAPIVRPSKIYLCSLSPFFKEDRGKYPDSYAVGFFGKRRMDDFWSYSADKIAEQINKEKISTVVVYGEKEHQTSPNLVVRCQQVAQKIAGAETVEIPGAPHNMSDDTYSAAMVEMI